jgi:hypothetical protein
LQTPMNRDLQAKSEQQQQQQQHDCGKHNLNFLRSYYKRKQKKQKEKTNTSKAIFDSYRDLQAKLEQQQKQQYDCGKPQNFNFLSSYQKKKTKKTQIEEEEETQQQQQKPFVQTLTDSYRDLEAKLEQQKKQRHSSNRIAANIIIT